MPILPIKAGKVFHEDNLEVYEATMPLRLSWAITIHKSQGLTIDHLYVNLQHSFTEGQVYTALSRVKTLNTIQVDNFDIQSIRCNKSVQEFYKRCHQKEVDLSLTPCSPSTDTETLFAVSQEEEGIIVPITLMIGPTVNC